MATAAFVEHRPRSDQESTPTKHYTIVADGKDHGEFKTQEAARDHACENGYSPVHVARVRHLQDRDKPAHWRKDPCD